MNRLALFFLVLTSICGCNIGIDAEPSPDTEQASKPAPKPVFDFVFASKRTGEYDVFGLPTNGSAPVNLTVSPALDLAPSWSHDGTKVVYCSTASGVLDLRLVTVATHVSTALTTGLANACDPVYTPDNLNVVFDGSSVPGGAQDIYRISVAGGAPTQLTNDPTIDTGPTVGPDGTIYFVSARSGAYEVWGMNADGTDQHQITTGSGVLGKPAASPNGLVIAYTRLDGAGFGKIVSHNLVTSVEVDLTSNNDSEPAFSRDGNTLGFSSQRDGNPEAYTISLTTGQPTDRRLPPALGRLLREPHQ